MKRSVNAPAIVEARQLKIPAVGTNPTVRIDYQLLPGEMHLWHSPDAERSHMVVNTLLGLTTAIDGVALFQGEAWRAMRPEQAARMRRLTGRVQSRGNWMQSVSVLDNILLPLMHNTIVPEEILRAHASDLASRFGLPGLPTDLPQSCASADLEKCACIRALLGRPQLRNGAVLWLSEAEHLINDLAIPASRRFRLTGSQLHEVELADA